MKTNSPSLDSPLAEAVLERKTCRLLQEELRMRGVTTTHLARTLSLPVPIIDAALQGQCALKAGMWKGILAELGVKSSEFRFRKREGQEEQRWEPFKVFMMPGWREIPMLDLMRATSTLPSLNSPLAEAVLEPQTAKMLQEHLQYKRVTTATLAKRLCLPLPILEDAIKGMTALKIGTWRAMQRSLEINTEHYKYRPSERHSGKFWELYNEYMVPPAQWRGRLGRQRLSVAP